MSVHCPTSLCRAGLGASAGILLHAGCGAFHAFPVDAGGPSSPYVGGRACHSRRCQGELHPERCIAGRVELQNYIRLLFLEGPYEICVPNVMYLRYCIYILFNLWPNGP